MQHIAKKPSLMKHTYVLTLLLLLSSGVTGCGGGPPATAPTPAVSTSASAPSAAVPTTQAYATVALTVVRASVPVTLTVFAPQEAGVDLATNSFTRAMEQQFNIRFKWQTTSTDSAAATQQRKLSLLGDTAPDLYLLSPGVDLFSRFDLLHYGQQGRIVPLNALIEQYAPHITAAFAAYPDFRALSTAPDGKIYGLPQYVDCYHCSYPNKLWINTRWLKQVGLTLPTTTAEFKAVLEAFKTRDPNGNGLSDEVPLSGALGASDTSPIPFLMDAFIYDDARTYLVLNNGHVDTVANKAAWRTGLRYIQSLYAAGLLDPRAFTQNLEAYQRLGNNPAVPVLGAATGLFPGRFVSLGSDRDRDYVVLPPLRGPEGATYATYNNPTTPSASFVLTSNARPEAQVAAIKMLDYLFTTEGQLRGHFGVEGQDWRRPQSGDVAINPLTPPLFAANYQRKAGEPNPNRAWRSLAQYFQPRVFRDGWVQATDTTTLAGFERRLQEATQLYDGKQGDEIFPYWKAWIDPAEADAVAVRRTSINEYIEQNALLFITGAKDLDKDWDAYIGGLEQLQLNRYVAGAQQGYERGRTP